jgi:tetratricopeptide (TPR) repeat protein
MEGPDGIQLEYPAVGPTMRGILWAGTRRSRGDRIVRIVEPRLCDRGFKQALANLRSKQYPRMLPIVGEGWFGVHYYVEYAVDSPWKTLDQYFGDLKHWRYRLEVITQLENVLDQWSPSPVHPLGLNGRNIVVLNDGGRWFPWLLPCPPVRYSSPCDLFGPDSPISTVAPEGIRGVPFSDRATDVYALGCLAAKALGCRESPEATSDEIRVEAQARGALLMFEMSSTDVEPFIRDTEALKALNRLILRCTHTSPEARPPAHSDGRDSFTGVFAETDPVNMALGLVRQGGFHKALDILEWGFAVVGETPRGRLLAADICMQLEDLPGALRHLDRAVLLTPYDRDLRARRCDLRWLLYSSLPALSEESDAEGDLLLSDLEFLKAMSVDGSHRNLLYKRAAFVYRRRKNWKMAADELYEAAQLAPSDLEALLLYAESLAALADRGGAASVVELANGRIGNMLAAQLLEEAEAREWREKFEAV